MSEQDFQQQVLKALGIIQSDVSTLKSDVSTLKEDLATFRANQEEFNQASWKLHTQAFQAINDIRAEVVSPWKIRATQNT
jgi:sensor domain CHASE-containing protein